MNLHLDYGLFESLSIVNIDPSSIVVPDHCFDMVNLKQTSLNVAAFNFFHFEQSFEMARRHRRDHITISVQAAAKAIYPVGDLDKLEPRYVVCLRRPPYNITYIYIAAIYLYDLVISIQSFSSVWHIFAESVPWELSASLRRAECHLSAWRTFDSRGRYACDELAFHGTTTPI